MIRRLAAVSLAGVVLLANLSFAQRPTNDLVVKVTYDNGRAVPAQMRVQLTSATGVPIMELNTRDQGEVRFIDVGAGTFRIKISGQDIEEKTSEAFQIDPRDNTHMEFISVTRKPGAPTSAQGSVAAWQLNVPAKAESEFEKGMKAFNKKDMEEALKRFKKVVELYPNHAAAINLLGVIAMQQGNAQEGQQYFQQALKIDDRHAASYLNLAKIRIAEKKRDEALELLTKATTIDASNGEGLALLTMLDYESNRMGDAVVHARRIHGLPDHQRFAFAHYIAGKALEAQNLTAEAVAEYQFVLSEAPGSTAATRAKAALEALQKK